MAVKISDCRKVAYRFFIGFLTALILFTGAFQPRAKAGAVGTIAVVAGVAGALAFSAAWLAYARANGVDLSVYSMLSGQDLVDAITDLVQQYLNDERDGISANAYFDSIGLPSIVKFAYDTAGSYLAGGVKAIISALGVAMVFEPFTEWFQRKNGLATDYTNGTVVYSENAFDMGPYTVIPYMRSGSPSDRTGAYPFPGTPNGGNLFGGPFNNLTSAKEALFNALSDYDFRGIQVEGNVPVSSYSLDSQFHITATTNYNYTLYVGSSVTWTNPVYGTTNFYGPLFELNWNHVSGQLGTAGASVISSYTVFSLLCPCFVYSTSLGYDMVYFYNYYITNPPGSGFTINSTHMQTSALNWPVIRGVAMASSSPSQVSAEQNSDDGTNRYPSTSVLSGMELQIPVLIPNVSTDYPAVSDTEEQQSNDIANAIIAGQIGNDFAVDYTGIEINEEKAITPTVTMPPTLTPTPIEMPPPEEPPETATPTAFPIVTIPPDCPDCPPVGWLTPWPVSPDQFAVVTSDGRIALIDITDTIKGWTESLTGIYQSYVDLLGSVFGFLPDEIQVLFKWSMAALVFTGILKRWWWDHH